MMGVPVEYNDNVEPRRTHPLLLPIIETERVSLPDGDILEKIDVVVPVKKVAKPGAHERKRSIQGSKHKSISTKAKPLVKKGVCWESPSMDRVPNPIGKRVVPVIQPSTRPYLKNPREPRGSRW